MVVEDNKVNQRLLVTYAKKRSYNILVANDGKEALDLYTQSCETARPSNTTAVTSPSGPGNAPLKPDVILMDINMPIMDGLKLIQRVRTDPMHSETPIVVITTEGGSADRDRALRLGANAYITKPIQAPKVIATVKELLKIG